MDKTFLLSVSQAAPLTLFFFQTHSLDLHLKSDVNFDMVPAPQEAAVFQGI